MAKNAGPTFLNQERTEGWVAYKEEDASALEEMWYQVRRLVEMKDKDIVEKFCTEAIEKFNREEKLMTGG